MDVPLRIDPHLGLLYAGKSVRFGKSFFLLDPVLHGRFLRFFDLFLWKFLFFLKTGVYLSLYFNKYFGNLLSGVPYESFRRT